MGWNELDQRGCRDGGGAWERDETSVCSGGGRSGLKKVKDPVSSAQVGPECRGSGGAHRIQGSFWCFVWVGYLDRIKNFEEPFHFRDFPQQKCCSNCAFPGARKPLGNRAEVLGNGWCGAHLYSEVQSRGKDKVVPTFTELCGLKQYSNTGLFTPNIGA